MRIYQTATIGEHYISERKHTARKNHSCCNCNQTIKKDNVYTKTVGTYDGYFVSNAWHTDCHKNHLQYLKDQARKEG